MATYPTSRTIVLTGVTRGLGRALLDEFVARGHTVWGCGRSAAGIDALQARFSAPHAFAAVDVADHAAVAGWAGALLAGGQAPDLIINNAALMNDPAPLWRVPPDEFRRLMEVNIAGTVHVIGAFMPAMLVAGCGIVANLSSGWGRSTAPEVAPYCASKFAIEGLTRSLAQELPRPLAAVAVNPGVIDTDMLRRCWSDAAAAYPAADQWAPAAATFFLALGPRDNGKSVSI